jgi:hypothetical protein
MKKKKQKGKAFGRWRLEERGLRSLEVGGLAVTPMDDRCAWTREDRFARTTPVKYAALVFFEEFNGAGGRQL